MVVFVAQGVSCERPHVAIKGGIPSSGRPTKRVRLKRKNGDEEGDEYGGLSGIGEEERRLMEEGVLGGSKLSLAKKDLGDVEQCPAEGAPSDGEPECSRGLGTR